MNIFLNCPEGTEMSESGRQNESTTYIFKQPIKTYSTEERIKINELITND